MPISLRLIPAPAALLAQALKVCERVKRLPSAIDKVEERLAHQQEASSLPEQQRVSDTRIDVRVNIDRTPIDSLEVCRACALVAWPNHTP